jgi:hypothetical protein
MNDTCDEKKLKDNFEKLFDKYKDLNKTISIDTPQYITEFNELKVPIEKDIKSECAVETFCNVQRCLDNDCNMRVHKYDGLTKKGAFNIYPENICTDKQVKNKFLEDYVGTKANTTPEAITPIFNNKTPLPTTINRRRSIKALPVELMEIDTINRNTFKIYDFHDITQIEQVISAKTKELEQKQAYNKILKNEIEILNDEIEIIEKQEEQEKIEDKKRDIDNLINIKKSAINKNLALLSKIPSL